MSRVTFSAEQLTIVIPFHAVTKELEQCLRALFSMDSFACPVVLVADGTSMKPEIDSTENFPVSFIELKERRGPAIARNMGADSVQTKYCLFLDSDVVLPKNSLSLIKNFYEQGNHTGIGIYASTPPLLTLPGRYKNSYMRYSYANFRGGDVPAFLTSAATCTKEVFVESGGFDGNYTMPSVEDADLGYRMRQRGFQIKVVPDFEVDHLHEYSVSELLITGFMRAAAVARMSLRRKLKESNPSFAVKQNKRTSPLSFRLSLVFGLLFLVSSVSIIFLPYNLMIAFMLYCLIIIINKDFLSSIRVQWGRQTAIACSLLVPFDSCAHAFGVIWGGISYFLGRDY